MAHYLILLTHHWLEKGRWGVMYPKQASKDQNHTSELIIAGELQHVHQIADHVHQGASTIANYVHNLHLFCEFMVIESDLSHGFTKGMMDMFDLR